MKQLKIKKNSKKLMPKTHHPKMPFKVKTNVKSGLNFESLWSWVPGLGSEEKS